MDLYIIRHGRPVRQTVGEDEGADPELSDIGHEQARRTAAYLEDQGIDHVVSSTMRRAFQTAIPTAEMLGVDVEQLEDLIESDHRSNTYVPLEEMSADDPDTAHYFDLDNLEDHIFSDGIEEFQQRVVRGFEHVIATNRGKRVAVFCHGMVTTVYLKSLIGIDDVLSMRPDYCGLTQVQASSTGIRTVRSFNETHHIRDLIER
ncbi:MAG: histidine phosphatase family protein [Actinomycetota bacterium]